MEFHEIRRAWREVGRHADQHDDRACWNDAALRRAPAQPRGHRAHVPAQIGDNRQHAPRQRQSARDLILSVTATIGTSG